VQNKTTPVKTVIEQTVTKQNITKHNSPKQVISKHSRHNSAAMMAWATISRTVEGVVGGVVGGVGEEGDGEVAAA
jgi:hypothetical protein